MQDSSGLPKLSTHPKWSIPGTETQTSAEGGEEGSSTILLLPSAGKSCLRLHGSRTERKGRGKLETRDVVWGSMYRPLGRGDCNKTKTGRMRLKIVEEHCNMKGGCASIGRVARLKSTTSAEKKRRFRKRGTILEQKATWGRRGGECWEISTVKRLKNPLVKVDEKKARAISGRQGRRRGGIQERYSTLQTKGKRCAYSGRKGKIARKGRWGVRIGGGERREGHP